MTNQKIALMMGVVSLFSACSEELANNLKNAAEAQEEASAAVLEKGAKLSDQPCDSANVGEKLFVTDSSATFVCNGKKWEPVKDSDGKDSSSSKVDTIVVSTKDTVFLSSVDTIVVRDTVMGLNGKDGTSCTAEKVEKDNRNGVALKCGDAVVDTVWDGESFNASAGGLLKSGAHISSCSGRTVVKGMRKGVELTCDGSVIDTVWNGKDGKDGKNGRDGKDGQDGHDGRDGVGCYGNSFNGGLHIMCGGNYVGDLLNGEKGEKGDAGLDGKDGANCEAVMVDGGVQVVCGKSMGFLKNGRDGDNCSGNRVYDMEADREGTEITCGGVVVDTIWDGLNGKDGKDGKDGKNGLNGKDGKDGESCSAQETVDDNGRKGLAFTCGNDYVGSVWDGIDGVDGSSCTGITAITGGRQGVAISCGGKFVGMIWDGIDGVDGTSCTAKPTHDKYHDGIVVTCGDEFFGTIWNGDKGDTGEDLIATEGSVSFFIDKRDGHEYKSVVIGGQTWMAENLSYEYDMYENWCYGEKNENCEKYGRLYTWYATWGDVCPDGWHIPEKDEWFELLEYLGGEMTAATKLKSTDWTNNNGTNAVGFNALPAGLGEVFEADGRILYMGEFSDVGEKTEFLFGHDESSVGVVKLSTDNDYASVEVGDSVKKRAFSIRCIKN